MGLDNEGMKKVCLAASDSGRRIGLYREYRMDLGSMRAYYSYESVTHKRVLLIRDVPHMREAER